MASTCLLEGCEKRRFAEAICWVHLQDVRLERGDLCAEDDCARPRQGSELCSMHNTVSSRSRVGRKDKRVTIACSWCGKPCEKRVDASRARRYCSLTCRTAAQFEVERDRLRPVHVGPPVPRFDLPLAYLQRALPRIKRRFASGDCLWCGEWFTAAFNNDDVPRCCSQRCARKMMKAKGSVDPRVRRAVYERDKWTCQLCGEPVDPDLPVLDLWSATLDHVEPQSRALVPDHSPENLRLAHRWCNSVRGDESHYSADVLKVA